MSQSNATVSPTNTVLTPMRVKFNGVDLGGTVDSVTFTKKLKMADVKVDQFGDTAIDKRVAGYDLMVKFTIAEIKNIDNWKVAFPSSHEIVNGGTKSLYTDMNIGDSLLSSAHQLLLHPLSNTDADLSGDYLFYKAACIQASEVKYGPDKQAGLNVEFYIFPDTSVVPAKFYTLGDPSNGIVHALAGSATPGSNTGNGTLDTITVSDQFTKTETITVTVVGTNSGNDVYVSGSVSGALGEFHIAAGSGSTHIFTSPQINFTLHQGTVQYAYNDSFTIATTASNFA